MPIYFWVSKIDINILLEFVLPAEKVGGWGLKTTKTFRFVKTIGNPGRPLKADASSGSISLSTYCTKHAGNTPEKLQHFAFFF